MGEIEATSRGLSNRFAVCLEPDHGLTELLKALRVRARAAADIDHRLARVLHCKVDQRPVRDVGRQAQRVDVVSCQQGPESRVAVTDPCCAPRLKPT